MLLDINKKNLQGYRNIIIQSLHQKFAQCKLQTKLLVLFKLKTFLNNSFFEDLNGDTVSPRWVRKFLRKTEEENSKTKSKKIFLS
jgi:hypothetical protein